MRSLYILAIGNHRSQYCCFSCRNLRSTDVQFCYHYSSAGSKSPRTELRILYWHQLHHIYLYHICRSFR